MLAIEVPDFCDARGIDWAPTDAGHPLGEGAFFHWNNPRDTGDDECCHLTLDGLAALSAEEFYRVVVNGRDIKHMTRVVGYFSDVSNWNKSKVGELRDRQGGNYAIG